MKQQVSRLVYNKFLDCTPALPQYNSTASFDWIKDSSGLPWLPLEFTIPHQEILEEIKKVESLLVSHRYDHSESQGWSSFCIHGKDADATREDAYYNDNRPYQWTDQAITYMPATVNYFKNVWPGSDYERVRVMRLQPGGHIALHQDGKTPGLHPINIAITQPNNCGFVMEHHGCVPFTPGQALWLDISNKHTLFNDSQEDRWHIIVHQTFEDPKFREIVVNSYKRLYNSSNENRKNYNP